MSGPRRSETSYVTSIPRYMAVLTFQTPEQNKRIRFRIDLFLLPLFLITQTLQYLDKTALNYAKVFGMEKAMGMTGNQFSLGAAIFYM